MEVFAQNLHTHSPLAYLHYNLVEMLCEHTLFRGKMNLYLISTDTFFSTNIFEARLAESEAAGSMDAEG